MVAANLIDGRAIASEVLAELVGRISGLKSRGVKPGLCFVRVGEDPASKVYVGRKEKACSDLGIYSETRVLPEATIERELLSLLAGLNADPRRHGILVEAPPPAQICQAVIYSPVLPETEVDGISPV